MNLRDLEGQLLNIKGNQPILLDDPQTVWVIQSGSLALFAVNLEEEQNLGSRRYLFSCESGSALFGTLITPDQNCQILAVPIGEVELLEIETECFRELVINGESQIATWITTWLEQWGNVFADITPPAIDFLSEGKGNFALLENQTFGLSSGKTSWIKIQQGTVHLMGFPELKLTSTDFFPLSDKMWLTADESVQLSTQPITSVNNLDALISGLSQLQIKLLCYIDELKQQETTDELSRLQAQENFNHQVITEALRELTSVLGEKNSVFFGEGTSLLLVAVGAVGKAMGVTIRPPVEDLKQIKDPLAAIARASRLKIRRVLLRDNWWKKDGGPILAYTIEDNRPVALLPISATCYEIFEGSKHTRRRVNSHIAQTLAPFGYIFYRSLPDKALSILELIHFATQGRGADLWMILFTGLAITLLGILNPYATTILFDNAIPNGDKDLLLQVGLGLLVATLGASIFLLAQGFALLRVETRGEAVAQTAVWNRLLSLPVSFARRYTTGDLLSRVLSVITIRQQLSGPTLINFTNGLFALFYLGLLIYYNWQLSIIPLIAAGLTIVITVIGGLLLMRIFNPLLELQGQITGQNVQLINGISKLRIASAEKSAFATWSKNYTQQVKLEIKAQQIEDWIILFTKVMPTIASGVLFFTLRQLSQNQITNEITGIGLSIGTILAFNSAFSTFLGGVSDLNNSVSSALRVLPQSKRLEPILQTKPEVELGKTEPGRLKGNLFIDHVTFRYRSNGPLILDNVAINAQPGEFIALVGSSGSGKSTLLRLLLGFETPESGVVYYDGQDLLGLDRDAVRRQLGVVLQNARLMSGSIFENIAGGSQITLEEAWEAARLSGLADDIEAMPMEMHTVINEGASNISGGQRQRLLIARALALKPRLLLFDEATSALDNRTQAIVSESLEQLKVTRIVIAHRLSTIRHAHRIYVLQAGRIVQQGCFEDLASQEGLFARLIARQIA